MFEALLEFLHLREHQVLEEEKVRVAVTLVLVDLAFIDNHFQSEEYRFLHERLQKLLNLSEGRVEELIERARDLRVTSGVNPERRLARVSKRMSDKDRKRVAKVMEEFIGADHETHSFEKHLLERYRKILFEESD